jgi:hypothetical protein
VENETKSKGGLIWLVVVIGLIGFVGSSIFAGRGNTNVAPVTDNSQQPAAVNTTPNTAVPSQTAIQLSQAVQNYSDNSNYNFNDGSGSNVDIVGTIKDIIPAQSQNAALSAFGNTIIIIDGIYSAAIHEITDSDFQTLSKGDKVEVKGGYMQSPENNVVQIVKVGSVTRI